MSNLIYDQYEADGSEEPVELTFDQYAEMKAMCEEIVRQAKAAEKLATIPEFQEVVMQAYFEKEPARLGLLIASGRLPDKQVDKVIEDLKAIGSLNMFLSEYVQKGITAQNELASLEEAWDEKVEGAIA